MEEFKFYSVSDEYIEWLRATYPNVYSNKVEGRHHTRKYIGVVLRLNNYNYYVPLSSPKNSDYLEVDDTKKIRKSTIPIVRIVVENSIGEKELKGTLRISHMIPVPSSELTLYDLENETDELYKDLVQNEIIFIRKSRKKIMTNARLLYKQKTLGDNTAEYVNKALDYAALESLCDLFEQQKRE